MNFFLNVEEPLFHCIQGVRFVGARDTSHDCGVTFLEQAGRNLNKILAAKINFDLTYNLLL